MAAGSKKGGYYCRVGEEVGTGSLISVNCGFRPASVKIWNRTRNVDAAWTAVMPQDSARMIIDSGAGTTDLSFITTNAITATPRGFTIGTNSSLNTASDIIYWEACRDSNVYGV